MIKIDGFSIVLLTQKMGKRAEFSFESLQILETLFYFFFGGGFSSPVDILYIYTTFSGYIMIMLYFTKWSLVQGDD